MNATTRTKKKRARPVNRISKDDLSSNDSVYEQRYMPRWEASTHAYYRVDGDNVIRKTQTKDLNLTGACLCVSPEVHPNQKLDMKIYLAEDVSFETVGTVKWKNSHPDQNCHVGVIFDKLSPQIQELIVAHAFEIKEVMGIKDSSSEL